MMRSSSRILRALFAIVLLLITAHRLPAPISEVPETTPTPKPKSNRQVTESAPKQQSATKAVTAPAVSFAGTWTGTANGRINQAVFGQKGFSSNYNLQISADERTATWTSSAWIFAKFHAPVQKNGRTLSWTCERHDIAGKTTVFCRLEMDANGTARYSESSGLVNGVFKGAGYEISGTLVRQ
jgi:hypothetical protein